MVEVHHARTQDETTGERVGGAQREVTRTDLGDRAGTLHGFVHHDGTRAAQVERAVDIVIVRRRIKQGQRLTSVDRVVGKGTAGDRINREVLSRGVTVPGDDDLTATQHAASRVIRQLTDARVDVAVGIVRHRPDTTRVDGDDTGVVVGCVVDLTRVRQGQGAAGIDRDITRVALAGRDDDIAARKRHPAPGGSAGEDDCSRVNRQGARSGVRAVEGLRTRTDLGDTEGITRPLSQRTREDVVSVVGTDVEVAHVRVRGDRTGTRKATDDFGARGHR